MRAALGAFKGTVDSLGLPPVRLFFTDNPSADHKFYQRQLPSLARQQEVFNNQTVSGEQSTPTGLPRYNYKSIKVSIPKIATEVNDYINAMLSVMVGKCIGLDAEWEKILNSAGYQTGSSKVNTIQVAFRDRNNTVNVGIFRTKNFTYLPNRLKALLLDSNIAIAGNMVSADLKKIGRDFNIDEIKSVEQKDRPNVFNLGMAAKRY